MEIGGSKGSSSQRNRVQIPDWLQPFVRQATNVASGALGSLGGAMSGDTVFDLTPEQQASIDMIRNMVGGDYFGTAQNVFMDAAQGQGLDFLDPNLVAGLMGTGVEGLGSFIDQARQAVDFTQNPAAQAQLERTAAGDYLFGGEGFDQAVNAAMNRAIPQISSVFGGDAANVASGLASSAVAQAGLDAFAGQYGQERGRQLGAAQALDQGGRIDRGQYLGLAGQELGRQGAGQQFLAGLTNQERQRQMAAAAGLPDIGMLDANAMMNIGGILQGQGQRELDAPINNQLRLLMAALQGPGSFAPFLGSNQRGRTSNVGFGFSIPGGGETPWWI